MCISSIIFAFNRYLNSGNINFTFAIKCKSGVYVMFMF